jgi:hypothetical protein
MINFHARSLSAFSIARREAARAVGYGAVPERREQKGRGGSAYVQLNTVDAKRKPLAQPPPTAGKFCYAAADIFVASPQ